MPDTAAPSIDDRLAALEARLDALVAELHRHISLQLPAPTAPGGEFTPPGEAPIAAKE